jgi:hypothetical protein
MTCLANKLKPYRGFLFDDTEISVTTAPNPFYVYLHNFVFCDIITIAMHIGVQMAKRKSDDLSSEELAALTEGVEEMQLPGFEIERLSVSLPAKEAQKLREAAGDGSISKKIRQAIDTQLFLEDQIKNGGGVYVKTKDDDFKKLTFD